MIWRIFTLIFFLFLSSTLHAQGTWDPAAADLRYPRTLLKQEHLPEVQQALSGSQHLELYTGIFNSIATPLPAAPTADHNARRAHATQAKNTAFVVLMNRRPGAGA